MTQPQAQPRILVVRLSAIGDCLHALPVLAALRRQYPAAFLGWAIEAAPYALLEGLQLVDRFHLFPRREFKRKEGSLGQRLGLLWRFRRELRRERYQIALDLQGLTKSGLVAWWSGARRRIGFRGPESRELNGLFLNQRLAPPSEAVHVVDRNLSLLRALDSDSGPVGWPLPSFEAERRSLGGFLEQLGAVPPAGRPFAVLNPGATWATKRWPVQGLAAVARGLALQQGLVSVATWAGAEERAAAEAVVAEANAGLGPGEPARAWLAPPTTLRELAALLQQARLFVGNDSGPLHLAVALGVRSVAVFGASDHRRNGPYGAGHLALARGPECQPCWKTTCARGDLACLQGVTPAEVLAACAGVLGVGRGAGVC